MTKQLPFNEDRLISKLRWRIVPYIFLLYIVAMIDRVNISFAALEMNKALNISATAFGTIAGIFFIAYFFFEIPSNVIMYKVGARVWMARILLTWGAVTVLTGFVNNETQFGIARVLLGVAEAGFYPGIILYMTYWFPSKHLAKTLAIFMTGMAINNILVGPISTWIMDNIQWLNLPGWRWLFILEGIPALILGITTYFFLIDRPEYAGFLSKEEKDWLVAELKKEHDAKIAKNNISKWEALKNKRVWHLSIIFFGYVCAMYGLSMWMPQIIKALAKTLSNTQVGLISTIPYIFGVAAMILVARHSDKTMERRYHIGLPISIAFFGLIALTVTTNLVWSMVWIIVSIMGIYGFAGSFWTLPSAFLSEATAAVGIAMINSFANLGGFAGPYFVGYMKDLTNSTTAGMYFLAFCAIMAGVLTIMLPKRLISPE
ncbi:Hypothetical protein LUCI_2473 [Lucifera butyrica]|uniref:Major facilitator superfamily (MFS) profile domain-containing protein n=1 Tax=Lucifera butyrica TaxID=1351585 RepID=A0A498R7M7_9FIRM|nr:MFS transporter [Lucifera butyrica]VBB07229.1 Hypothetical protein LUCI_2473 [Lucifera butyrica]